jgi:hypothetical protein
VFLLDSFAALPTTGYVAGGSEVSFTGQAPDNVPSAALVGFDAAGKIQWANRYTFGGPPNYAASGHVGVQLTDEGGVVATTLLAEEDPLGGRLWAFEALAKDGSISFASDAERAPLALQNLDCSLTASNLSVTVAEHAISARSVLVRGTTAKLTTAQQTPN